MIISTSHNFVFIRVPKTGSTSAHRMLQEYHDPLTLDSKLNQHVTIDEINPRLHTGYKTCAFVRNPWDRLISVHGHLVTRGMRVPFDVDQWVRSLNVENIHENVLIKPQHAFINDSTRVFRYEEFNQQIHEMFEYLELPKPESVPHYNQTQHMPDRKYLLSDVFIERVGELYAKEIDMFDYSPPVY